MISKKLSQSLEIGIFILIVISSFLIFPKIGYGCRVDKNMVCNAPPGGGPYNCGFDTLLDNSWVCGIEINSDFQHYYCPLFSGTPVTACPSADAILTQDTCPNTNSYNGNTCIFADGYTYSFGIDCRPWGSWGSVPDDGTTKGKWNGADSACVLCNGKTRSWLLASNSTGKCFSAQDGNGFWVEGVCADDYKDTCDYGCGADLQCNHKAPSGVCNNCVFVGPPPLCPNGVLDAGEQCDPGPPAQDAACPGQCQVNCTCPALPPGDCELNCSCSCPACPCGSGTCPSELRGGLVPCGKNCNDPCTKSCECCPCTLCHLFVLFKRIVDFLTLNIIFPLAVLMIVVGGVMFLTAGGDPGRIGSAKKILTATVIGLAIILAAWLIVDTVITFITPAASPLQNWNTINCPVP